MKHLFPAALIVLGLALPAAAQTFRAENRVDVTPGSNNTLSITSGGDYGARGMWCAASDYAQDVLNARGTDRLVIDQPRTSASSPVVFALKPRGDGNQSVLIVGSSLRMAGVSLSVAHAYQFCYDARITNSR